MDKFEQAKEYIYCVYLQESSKEDFIPQYYFWELGIQLIKYLESESIRLLGNDFACAKTLFGIAVSPNYEEPFSVKLYKDVTKGVSK